jgi:enoyl-CoA hydratase/carnithine racemase
MPEPKRHLPSGPASVHLSRMVPLGEAMRIELTGDPIDAERAYQIGLVQGLYDDRAALEAAADEMAGRIMENSPLAVRSSWLAAVQVSAADADRGDRDHQEEHRDPRTGQEGAVEAGRQRVLVSRVRHGRPARGGVGDNQQRHAEVAAVVPGAGLTDCG